MVSLSLSLSDLTPVSPHDQRTPPHRTLFTVYLCQLILVLPVAAHNLASFLATFDSMTGSVPLIVFLSLLLCSPSLAIPFTPAGQRDRPTFFSPAPHEQPAASPVSLSSSSPSALPSIRPPPSQRKFNSTAINSLIDSVSSRMVDADLATLFSNCLPCTLDTTVMSFSPRTCLVAA